MNGTPLRLVAPSMTAIKAAVAEEYGVSMMDLVSERRTAAVVRPRQAAMWLCRRLTGHSLPAIGKAFGDRDHSTVLHALRAVEARMVHPEEYERLERLTSSVNNGVDARDIAADRAAWALREVEGVLEEVDALQKRLRRMQLALALDTGAEDAV